MWEYRSRGELLYVIRLNLYLKASVLNELNLFKLFSIKTTVFKSHDEGVFVGEFIRTALRPSRKVRKKSEVIRDEKDDHKDMVIKMG